MGEVVQDGETVLRYLWSADLTVLNSSRPGLSEALAAAEHTGYDALLAACTDAQTEPVKGIAVCSDPAWTAKMDAGWTDAKNAAALYAPEAAVTAAEPVPLYNADAGFRAAVDAQELERTAEVSTLVPNEKRVIFYTDVNSVNSVCYTVEDGVLIKYVDTDITYSCEAVTVIYTRAELGRRRGRDLRHQCQRLQPGQHLHPRPGRDLPVPGRGEVIPIPSAKGLSQNRTNAFP